MQMNQMNRPVLCTLIAGSVFGGHISQKSNYTFAWIIHVYRARICKRLRSLGITATYSLAESISWNQFLGSLNVYKLGLFSIET